jgi:hypothetical protein
MPGKKVNAILTMGYCILHLKLGGCYLPSQFLKSVTFSRLTMASFSDSGFN